MFPPPPPPPQPEEEEGISSSGPKLLGNTTAISWSIFIRYFYDYGPTVYHFVGRFQPESKKIHLSASGWHFHSIHPHICIIWIFLRFFQSSPPGGTWSYFIIFKFPPQKRYFLIGNEVVIPTDDKSLEFSFLFRRPWQWPWLLNIHESNGRWFTAPAGTNPNGYWTAEWLNPFTVRLDWRSCTTNSRCLN